MPRKRRWRVETVGLQQQTLDLTNTPARRRPGHAPRRRAGRCAARPDPGADSAASRPSAGPRSMRWRRSPVARRRRDRCRRGQMRHAAARQGRCCRSATARRCSPGVPDVRAAERHAGGRYRARRGRDGGSLSIDPVARQHRVRLDQGGQCLQGPELLLFGRAADLLELPQPDGRARPRPPGRGERRCSLATFDGTVLTALKEVEQALARYAGELDRNAVAAPCRAVEHRGGASLASPLRLGRRQLPAADRSRARPGRCAGRSRGSPTQRWPRRRSACSRRSAAAGRRRPCPRGTRHDHPPAPQRVVHAGVECAGDRQGPHARLRCRDPRP